MGQMQTIKLKKILLLRTTVLVHKYIHPGNEFNNLSIVSLHNDNKLPFYSRKRFGVLQGLQ